MSEKDRIIEPLKYYIHEKATYDAMLAAGEIKDGVEYWIKETGEIFVFDGKFGGASDNVATKEELSALKGNVVDNEEVAAAAFNDIKKDIANDRRNLLESYYNKQYIDGKIAEIIATITDNEEVTAAAFNDIRDSVIGALNTEV